MVVEKQPCQDAPFQLPDLENESECGVSASAANDRAGLFDSSLFLTPASTDCGDFQDSKSFHWAVFDIRARNLCTAVRLLEQVVGDKMFAGRDFVPHIPTI